LSVGFLSVNFCFLAHPSTISDHVRKGKKANWVAKTTRGKKLLKFLLKEARVQQKQQQRGSFFLLGAFFLLPFSTFLPPPLIYRINVAGHDAPFSASAHSIGLLHSMEF
jgi:hypothetical protein